eukprot:SAG22_NODE_1578_length_4071_cov_5.302870_4_plen_96_part_00
MRCQNAEELAAATIQKAFKMNRLQNAAKKVNAAVEIPRLKLNAKNVAERSGTAEGRLELGINAILDRLDKLDRRFDSLEEQVKQNQRAIRNSTSY